MSSTFGKKIIYSLFGESHSDYVGITISNLPFGLTINTKFIDSELKRRRPKNKISTTRVENDEYKIISGFFNSKTTGAPLTILVDNKNVRSCDYNPNLPRPSHADYPAFVKYCGFNDYRGGGHFSGRMTVALVIAGSIIQDILLQKGITIGTHILSIGEENDVPCLEIYPEKLAKLHKSDFPTFGKEAKCKMQTLIETTKESGDSIGGILETFILGVPVGVGEPFFDSLESVLSHLIFSVPGIKGLSFGSGFDFAKGYGSDFNDQISINDSKIYTKTNHNGGINGGISNSMPIHFKSVVKPTPSIFIPQTTVDLESLEETTLSIHGRHDPCIVHRIAPVIDAVTAMGIYELLGE